MDRNKVEIKLLKKDPKKLLLEYQSMIRIIVLKQYNRGMLAFSEQEDLRQEINKKLLERMPRIQEQYNGHCKLKTYFSKIISNICLEELRKINMVSEPPAGQYNRDELADDSVEPFVIEEEFERLRKVIILKGNAGSRVYLMLKVMNELPVFPSDFIGFNYALSQKTIRKIAERLNSVTGKMKKEKMQTFGEALKLIDGKISPPDSLRKWYATHIQECVDLMNGNPPDRAHTIESLGILVEKFCNEEKKS